MDKEDKYKLTVRLDRELEKQIKKKAKRLGCTVQQIVEWTLVSTLTMSLLAVVALPAGAVESVTMPPTPLLDELMLREAPKTQQTQKPLKVKLPLKLTHPKVHAVLHKAGAPFRWTWNKCVWIGQKTEPIHPFLNLCGSLGSAGSPFVYGFLKR